MRPSSLIAIGNAHMGHVLLRKHKKIRIIHHDDPLLLQAIGPVHVIRRTTETSLYRRRDVDATAPQAFGDGVGEMLVKVKRIVLARRRIEVQDFGGITLFECLDECFRVAHVLADFLAVIVVVRQRCTYVCQREARKLQDDLIRGQPMHLIPDHNILHADTAARNARSSPACPWSTDDVLDETRGNIGIVR